MTYIFFIRRDSVRFLLLNKPDKIFRFDVFICEDIMF